MPAQFGDALKDIVGAFRGLHPKHVVVGDDGGLPDIEGAERRDHVERARDIGFIALGRPIAAKYAFRHQNFGRYILDADDPQAAALGDARNAGNKLVIAAAIGADETRHRPDRLPIEPQLRNAAAATPCR